MYERIIKIIAEFVQHMQIGGKPSGEKLQELERRGFTVVEISTALSWIAERIEAGNLIIGSQTSETSFKHRILNDIEKEVFSPEAWGLLVQYQELGILKQEQIEQIIDRGTLMNLYQADVHALSLLIIAIMFQQPESNHSMYRLLLQADERIH